MPVLLRNGRVFAPDLSFYDHDVLIDAGKIAAVGPGLQLPDGTRVLDVGGKTVLPGLIDAHTHITHGYEGSVVDAAAAQGVRAVAQAQRALRAGITYVRELGSYRQVDVALRNAVQSGLVSGPGMLCAGTYVTITGGHGHPKGRAADGVDEVRKAVREQVLAGADVIKIMCSGGAARADESADAAQFSFPEIQAAVEEAHFAGKPIAAHAHPTRSIKWALQAGADSIEHGTYLDEDSIDLMLATGAFLVPTLGVYQHIADSGQWPELTDRARSLAEAKVVTFRAALARGVPWAVGTDSSQYFPIEGYADELKALAKAGRLSNREVLRAATAGNAALLQLTDVGSIEVGKRADLVVVEGDPVADLDAIRHVSITVAAGRVHTWDPL